MLNVFVTLLHPHNKFLLNSKIYYADPNTGFFISIPLEPIHTDLYLEILHDSRRIFFCENLLDKKKWKFSQRYQEMEIYHVSKSLLDIEITFEIYEINGYILLRKIYFDWNQRFTQIKKIEHLF